MSCLEFVKYSSSRVSIFLMKKHMKYTCEVLIRRPKEKVAVLFENPRNLQHWQPGFISVTHLSGKPGQAGSRSRLLYKMDKREIEMIETVNSNTMPDAFNSTFETKNVVNIQENRFEKVGDNITRWVSYNEFRFGGIMKLVAIFMPGAFKKQSQKYLDMFKEYAEQNN